MVGLRNIEERSQYIVTLLQSSKKPVFVWNWLENRKIPKGTDFLIFNDYLSGYQFSLDKYMQRVFFWAGIRSFRLSEFAFSEDKEGLLCWADERIIDLFFKIPGTEIFNHEMMAPLFADAIQGFCEQAVFLIFYRYFIKINSDLTAVVSENLICE